MLSFVTFFTGINVATKDKVILNVAIINRLFIVMDKTLVRPVNLNIKLFIGILQIIVIIILSKLDKMPRITFSK